MKITFEDSVFQTMRSLISAVDPKGRGELMGSRRHLIELENYLDSLNTTWPFALSDSFYTVELALHDVTLIHDAAVVVCRRRISKPSQDFVQRIQRLEAELDSYNLALWVEAFAVPAGSETA